MAKRIVIFIVLFLGLGTHEISAQSLLKELGKIAEKSIKNAVKEQNSRKQSAPASRPAQAQAQAAPVEKPKFVAIPATHSAFMEPIGYACDEGKQKGTGTLPAKSESAQMSWVQAQPAVIALTNEALRKEYIALKDWVEKADFTVRDAVASRMYDMDNELSARVSAIHNYIAGLKKTRESEVLSFAKLLEGNIYKRVLNSSIAPLKPYFSESDLAYLESHGTLEEIHLAERTVWYPYDKIETVTSSVEGLAGTINLDGMADLGGMIFRLYPDFNHQKNVAILNSTHAESLRGKDIVIPSHIIRNAVSYAVIEIGGGAFYSNAMKSIVLPSTLKKIGQNAFANMAYVKKLVIPEGVTELLVACFHDSPELEEVYVPDSVTRIGGGCFANCPKLTTVRLPKSVKHFDVGQFDNCPSLVSVNLPENIKEIKTRMFRGCKSLLSLEIPKSVEIIAGSAFSGCSKLASVELPASLREIDDYAFEACSGLKSLVLPSSVKLVGSGAFSNCSALSSVVIEGTETEFDSFSPFEGCKSVKSVTMNSKYNDPGALSMFYQSAVYPRDKAPVMSAFTFVD